MEFEQIEFFVELNIVLQLFGNHLVESVLIVGDSCYRLACDRIDIKTPLAWSLWLERWRLVHPIFVCNQVISTRWQPLLVAFIPDLPAMLLIWLIKKKLIIQNVKVDVFLDDIVHMMDVL